MHVPFPSRNALSLAHGRLPLPLAWFYSACAVPPPSDEQRQWAYPRQADESRSQSTLKHAGKRHDLFSELILQVNRREADLGEDARRRRRAAEQLLVPSPSSWWASLLANPLLFPASGKYVCLQGDTRIPCFHIRGVWFSFALVGILEAFFSI